MISEVMPVAGMRERWWGRGLCPVVRLGVDPMAVAETSRA